MSRVEIDLLSILVLSCILVIIVGIKLWWWFKSSSETITVYERNYANVLTPDDALDIFMIINSTSLVPDDKIFAVPCILEYHYNILPPNLQKYFLPRKEII